MSSATNAQFERMSNAANAQFAREAGRTGYGKHDPPAPWIGIDWRQHQRWVQVQGCPINVIEIGSGEPVLFVHGLGGSWPNWLEQLPVLASGRRAIAFDLPGFGDSPMPAEPISIPLYARVVAGLMDALQIPSAAIVGNSMGGEITLELALSDPRRIERMVLVSPAGVSTLDVAQRLPLIRALYPPAYAISRWIGENADELVRRPRIRAALLKPVAARPRKIAPEFAAEQIRGVGKPGFLPALEAIVSHSQTLRQRLPQIACSTLVLWGDEDPVVPVRDVDVFAQAIPGASKVVWKGTGHVGMFERGAEFNALLDDFLAAA
jgi:pimeloyl-ACP methyl ester carboxylesterase